MFPNNLPLDRRQFLSQMSLNDLINIVVKLEQQLQEANDRIADNNIKNIFYSNHASAEKEEMRKCSLGLRNQLNEIYKDMNIPQGTSTYIYNVLRTKVNEMLTNQISSNLSVGSRCNSRSSSKRSYEDFSEWV